MNAIHLLSAVLALQCQALSFGAQVHEQVERTQHALYAQLDELTETLEPEEPEVDPEPPSVRVVARVIGAPQPPEDVADNEWDPEPRDVHREASHCRALLLEVIRRSAHDWVLYRNTRKPERVYALEAYTWLFEEEPGHPWWELRQKEGEPFMAFLNVCETLDLDPEVVRARVRQMTIRDIATAGRPAERRRPRVERTGIEDYEIPSELDLSALEEEGYVSSYEAQFSLG